MIFSVEVFLKSDSSEQKVYDPGRKEKLIRICLLNLFHSSIEL
jgi:hypothetical protein